jgi:predicted RND superfamily exporter protein
MKGLKISVDKLIEKYTTFLVKRHLLVLLVAVLATALAGISASRFTIKTDFAQLLPQDEPSIKDLEKAKQRKGGLSNMLVVVTGDDIQANRRLIDDLADHFKKNLSEEFLVYIRYNLKAEKEFYEKHKHLYADLGDLKEIYRRLSDKIRYERIKNNPVLSMDFDGEALAPVEFDVSDIREKYEKKTSFYERYIDGYFSGEDGHLFAIFLYPPGTATGVDFGKRMVKTVKAETAVVCAGGTVPAGSDPEQVISEGCKQRYHPSIEVGFAGGIVTAIVEQEAIISDLILVTCVCLFFVGLVVLLYFRAVRSLPLIGVPLLMGTTWTFGISIYIVEHLNTSTAFLAAIIVGNGINFGLIQMARYIEERRGGSSLEDALINALKYTVKATSTAALAASIAYGSLIITKFRGFNGFGYMGGLGMILCWVAAFSVQPALMVLLERFLPMRFRKKGDRVPTGLFARPYARFVYRHGLLLHLAGWVFAVVCIIATVPYLKDPFEYDFRNLRNQREGVAVYKLDGRVAKIFTRRLNPLFILADREDQVPLIVAEMDHRNEVGKYRGIFEEIRSIYSFLPKDQKKKMKVLKKIRKLLTKSTLSWLSEEDRAEVERYRPPDDLKELTKHDLPEGMTRIFKELDGRVGLPIAVYPKQGSSVSTWDGHFLLKLADASRNVNLPDGETVTSAGVATIFADMIKAIERDGPRAVVASLLGVMLLVLLAYKGLKYVLLILVSLFFGVVWTVGPAAMMDLKLNFLNFIALPITFGIGIDYAVNVLNRYRIEGPGSIQRVIGSTGGAVILCSLTTLIGYSSLLIADNQALVSFGLLADIGEVASLAAAVFLLPVLVRMVEQHDQRVKAQQSRKNGASS